MGLARFERAIFSV